MHEIIGVPTESLSIVQQGAQQQAETSAAQCTLIMWSNFLKEKEQSGRDADDQCSSLQVARMLRCRSWICKGAEKVGEDGGKSGSRYRREKETCQSLKVTKIVVSSPLGKERL